MTVYQLPGDIDTFTRWFAELAARVEAGSGWYEVFATRDPEGMRACLDGTEIPPWDVVESLLQDAGERADGPLAAQAGALYAAAAGAHDHRPGGADALARLRDLRESERRYAGARARELERRLGETRRGSEQAAVLAHDLAWARDDHARAAARVAELTARLVRLGDPVRAGAPAAAPERASASPGWVRPPERTHPPRRLDPTRPPHAADAPEPPATEPPATEPAATENAAARPAPARRRPRGARYAWLDGEPGSDEPVAVTAPVLPTWGTAPRGARFGGGEATPEAVAPAPDPDGVARAAANAVYALRRLRAQGRTGEAHALLCEALAGPPARLPALADELDRSGLAADWSTLLWEAASLPPGRLAAVAGALADAGRTADCEQLMRQGVARPVEELAGACAALRAEGHRREAHALLAAFVRARTPEEAARLAGADPRELVRPLLDAARGVSVTRERDLRHALRVAGLPGA
ncbi:UL36 very large tegument protein [Streptomyces sp. NPDC020807]|uniref:UL36 very large tegument protein n=1 Tax=Streptomyces sp. NPDC020807 TaxID=3155119 RepID=UPI0033F7479C